MELLEHYKQLYDGTVVKRGYKYGVPIEKGAVITEDWLKKNFEEVGKMISLFSAYPDLYIDLISREDDKISLFFYQRITLRAVMRFKEIFITAPRAFSKSFTCILGMMLQCIFIPGRKVFICAPGKEQSAKIATEKLTEIFDHWPLLRNEVLGGRLDDRPGNYGKDYVTLNFVNGSRFDVVGALETTRGGRRHGGIIDEIAKHEEQPLNEIVLPLLNVSRRLPDNTVNPHEPNQQVICVTSAGFKTSFAYNKMIDIMENEIIDPKNALMFGCDYRVPALHGLIDPTYINKLKMSPSYNERSFAREYASIWSSESEESWFNFKKMNIHRKVKNPEYKRKRSLQDNQFYVISVDVGRIHDQTAVCIFKVTVAADGRHFATLVNLKVLGLIPERKRFEIQAIDLKREIEVFEPRAVIIDTNGLGVGLADEMIKTQFDKETGKLMPAYGFVNDDVYKKIQPKDAPQILHGIKANGPLNSQIHSNALARINGGMVRFLISEQKAKSALLATQKGRKMKIQQRVKRLMPHEMTTSLFKEMSNLRLKRTGSSTDIVLEKINSRYPKDKYSSFSYGLWLIKQFEDEATKRRRVRTGNRKLVFFSEGRNGF